jgi:hypothetical protein
MLESARKNRAGVRREERKRDPQPCKRAVVIVYQGKE